MALTAAMGSGIAGLRAFMDALNVVGNNVANVNTYGYKAGRVTFKESIYSTQSAGSASTEITGGTNPNQIGYGSNIGTIDLDMSTQALESTGMVTDVAIQGDGFFLLGNKNGVTVDSLNSLMFSRVGNFKIDDDGYLTDGAGNIVYGFVPVNAANTADGTGQSATGGTTPSKDISTQLVPIRLPLAHEGDGTIKEGAAVYPGVNGGVNTNPADVAGATDSCIKYENLQIDSSGKVTCTNSMTDEIVTIGYIALGTVTNPAGLTHTDGPYYQATDSAGEISISTPKSSVTGPMNNGQTVNGVTPPTLLASSGTGVMSGFLEQSGTDLAQEFANMIIYQRGYQANTRIVTVTDTMLEELINMKR